MNGKIVALIVIACAALAGAAIYYLQVYGFYYEVPPGRDTITLVSLDGETAQPIAVSQVQAIDADSSPIRYRACFATDLRPAELAGIYMPAEKAEPRNAPEWFACFDAAAIGAALEDGTATAFIGAKNIEFGVDRIVAITEDGRGYVWHDLNNCGQKAYDGTVIGEECPPRPQPGGN